MIIELGNNHPVDSVATIDPETGETSRVTRPGLYPCVSSIWIPEGRAGRTIGLDQLPDEDYETFERRDAAHLEASLGDPLYSMPDEHDDELFAEHDATRHLAEALVAIPQEARPAIRRQLLYAQMANPNVGGLPLHAAFVVAADPRDGFWATVSEPGKRPAWVNSPDHPGLAAMLADYFDCPVGPPDDFEDLYLTRYGRSEFPPGAKPDPLSGFEMGHTTYGRLNQALQMGGFGYLGTVGTATAATATTLTGSAETGVTHTLNDCAGMLLVVGPNSAGTGSKVWGTIISNTTGTTPVYTVDRWYNAASPGGAAGTTPNATAFYQVVAAPPSIFVALSTDTTAFSLGGTGGTQDAATIAQALTGEITTAGGGLIRKIAPIGQSGATWTATPVFTANGTDSLPATVAKAALSPSIVSTNGALDYMTLVSPTAVMSASGDQLTITWTFTMT